MEISDDEGEDAEDTFPMEQYEGTTSDLTNDIENHLHTLDQRDEPDSGEAFIFPDDPADSSDVTPRNLLSVDEEDIMFPENDMLLILGDFFNIKIIRVS